ncbi:hypothetical protein [Tenacibaculum sp. SZ-18]|uniref:hypothetical protein n=1 Tax=Tenacibaculum sp. SZ-18 TaxID=754423 RepID=UPI0012FE5D24|nr:hypothetical protein [Tenacibaculum sp. SZ-18]
MNFGTKTKYGQFLFNKFNTLNTSKLTCKLSLFLNEIFLVFLVTEELMTTSLRAVLS